MTAKTTTIEVTTSPTAKTIPVRVAQVEKGRRLNRHYNDDGSITVYAAGLKVFRTLPTEGDDAADEDYDAEGAVEKFARRWFGSGKPVLFGKSTYGHNWKNKKAAAKAA
jgi:hypothetical protein